MIKRLTLGCTIYIHDQEDKLVHTLTYVKGRFYDNGKEKPERRIKQIIELARANNFTLTII